MALLLNPNLAVHPFDAASDQPMVICEVPAEKDSSLRYAIPAELLGLLKLFDGSRQTAEVVADYNRESSASYTPEKLEHLIENFLLPKTLLVSGNAPVVLPPSPPSRVPYLYAQVRLIPNRIVYPVARCFGWLFRTPLLLALLPVFVAAHLWFYLGLAPHSNPNIDKVTGAQFFGVTIITILGALIHETGHASALVSNGCKRTEIGIGLYLYFPVLYTDVSEAWRLSRGQRAMIDVGGIYFQGIFLLLLISLFRVTAWPTLLYSIFLINMSIARTLSPFLRMDGYWLVSDLFGISNLRKQSLKLLKYYALRLLRPRRAPTAPPLNLSPRARAVLCVYTLLCSVFFIWFCAVMYYQAAFYLIPNYPQYVFAVWQAVSGRPVFITAVFHAVFELLWRTTILFGLFFFLFRSAQALWTRLQRKTGFGKAKPSAVAELGARVGEEHP
jgi:putative peptide zinc metalloprotease protein